MQVTSEGAAIPLPIRRRMQVHRSFRLEHRLARVVHSPHPQGEDQGLAADGGVEETTRGADEGL